MFSKKAKQRQSTCKPASSSGFGLFLCRWLVKYAGRSLIGYLSWWSIVTALHCPDRGRRDTHTYCVKGLSFHRRGQRTHNARAHTSTHIIFHIFQLSWDVFNHAHLEAVLNSDWQINTLPFSHCLTHSAPSVCWLFPSRSHPDVNCFKRQGSVRWSCSSGLGHSSLSLGEWTTVPITVIHDETQQAHTHTNMYMGRDMMG